MNSDGIIRFLLPVVAASAVMAQGTFNASNYYNPPGSSDKAWVSLDGLGRALSRESGRIQIVVADDGTTVSPNGDAGVGLAIDGIFFINQLSVPGAPPGSSVKLIVRAWDSRTGATYATAWNRGQTLVNLRNLGKSTGPAATFRDDSDFVGISAGCISITTVHPLTLVAAAGGSWRLQTLVDRPCSTWFRLEVSRDLGDWRLLQAKRLTAFDQTAVSLTYEFSSSEDWEYFRLTWDYH